MRSSVVATVLGVFLTHYTASAAEPANHVRLRYSAPEACPDDAQLLALVEDFLGQPLRETRAQTLSATINVVGERSGFAAKLDFSSPRGVEKRFVDDEDCTKLIDAAALLVALAIDPERVQARQTAAIVAPRQPPAVSPPPAPPPPAAVSPSPRRLQLPARPAALAQGRWLGGAAAFISSGILPGLAPGVSVDFGATFGPFRALLVGNYWTRRRAEEKAPVSIELSLASAGLRACRDAPVGAWLLLGCAQVELGEMSGAGQNVDAQRSQHALYGALQALAFVEYRRWRPAPRLGLGLSWVALRPPFGHSVNGIPVETYRPSPAALLGYLGLSFGP